MGWAVIGPGDCSVLCSPTKNQNSKLVKLPFCLFVALFLSVFKTPMAAYAWVIRCLPSTCACVGVFLRCEEFRNEREIRTFAYGCSNPARYGIELSVSTRTVCSTHPPRRGCFSRHFELILMATTTWRPQTSELRCRQLRRYFIVIAVIM